MAIAFDPSSSVVVETMEFRLMCSYSQMRMTIPVRSDTCHHLQCCDLDSWVSLFAKFKAMRDPAAPCPVCTQRVLLSTLRVDDWMTVVLRNLPNTKLVLLSQDGSYRSGDTHRVIKRQREEEVILVTQCSEERDDDDENIGLKMEPAWTGARLSDETQDDNGAPPTGDAPPFLIKLEPGEHASTPPDDDEQRRERKSDVSLVSALPSSAQTSVNIEAAAALAGNKTEPTATLSPLDSKTCFQLSYAAEPQYPRRVLPAGWRRWSPYCPRCQTHCKAASEGDGQVQYDGDDAVFECPRCRSARSRCSWPAVRTFMKRRTSMHWQAPSAETAAQSAAPVTAEESSITLEVTEDETVIISGHRLKVGLLGHYLFRGGFSCGERVGGDSQPVEWDSSEGVVWYSSLSLPKTEIDFLETVCDAVVQGEDPIQFNGVAPFRFKFRYEKKLQQTQWNGSNSNNNYGMYTQQQPQSQQYHYYGGAIGAHGEDHNANVPTSPAGATSVVSPSSSGMLPTRSGSFRIQISR